MVPVVGSSVTKFSRSLIPKPIPVGNFCRCKAPFLDGTKVGLEDVLLAMPEVALFAFDFVAGLLDIIPVKEESYWKFLLRLLGL